MTILAKLYRDRLSFLNALIWSWIIWCYLGESDTSVGHLKLGLWLLAGLLTFAVIEWVLSSTANNCTYEDDVSDVDSDTQNNNTTEKTKTPMKIKSTIRDSFSSLNPFQGISSRRVNNHFLIFFYFDLITDLYLDSVRFCELIDDHFKIFWVSFKISERFWLGPLNFWANDRDRRAQTFNRLSEWQVTGYLNLLANGIDNFTHGLAVGGSFLVSVRVGLLTTAAILLHEIPHEVADFAILLRAGNESNIY